MGKREGEECEEERERRLEEEKRKRVREEKKERGKATERVE